MTKEIINLKEELNELRENQFQTVILSDNVNSIKKKSMQEI